MTDLTRLRLDRGFWYIATPYSKYAGGITEAHNEACDAAARLISAGVSIFCPIAHSHPIALHGGVDPLDHKVWLPADAPLMEAAHGILVVEMEGWQDSRGVQFEIDAFRDAGKPIINLSWPDLAIVGMSFPPPATREALALSEPKAEGETALDAALAELENPSPPKEVAAIIALLPAEVKDGK